MVRVTGMITVSPLTEVTLSHRAYRVAVAESGHVVAVSRDGEGSLLSPDHSTLTSFRCPFEPGDVAISPTGGLLAIAGHGGLQILSTCTLRPVYNVDDSFDSACFSGNGNLWTSVCLDDGAVALEARDAKTLQVLARTELTNPFGGSHFKLLPHPDKEYVAIWVAPGQDGQCLFWAHRHGHSIVVDRFPGIDATAPPSFSPFGYRFLVVCDSAELRHYSFPRGPLVAAMPWPFDGEGNQIGDIVSFVDQSHALLESNEGRLFLIDLHSMAIQDEVGIPGHEPKAVAEVYPSLRGRSGLCSDLASFLPLPKGGFLSIHRELPFRYPEERGDRLLTWKL